MIPEDRFEELLRELRSFLRDGKHQSWTENWKTLRSRVAEVRTVIENGDRRDVLRVLPEFRSIRNARKKHGNKLRKWNNAFARHRARYEALQAETTPDKQEQANVLISPTNRTGRHRIVINLDAEEME